VNIGGSIKSRSQPSKFPGLPSAEDSALGKKQSRDRNWPI